MALILTGCTSDEEFKENLEDIKNKSSMNRYEQQDLLEELKIGDTCENIAKNDWNKTGFEYCELKSYTCKCYEFITEQECIEWDIRNKSKICNEWKLEMTEVMIMTSRYTMRMYNEGDFEFEVTT